MTTRVRALWIGAVVSATMWLAGCGHYSCGATFGNSSCTASGSGLSQSGGTSTSSAFVFAVDEGVSGAANGSIDGFALDTSAVTFGPIPTFTAPTIPLNNGGTGMAVAQGKYLYAALSTAPSGIYGWSIGSSGALTAISGSPFSSPAAAGFIGGVGQDNLIVNPAGSLLFISDAVTSSVYTYSIGTGGVLTLVGTTACPSGFTPMNLTTDGLGKYLYVIDGTDATHQGSGIAAFSIGTGGTLTAVSGSPFTGTGFNMWQVKGEPSGQFLIGTSGTTVPYNGRDDDNLYVFTIAQSGSSAGAISLTTTQPTQNAPFSIAVSPNSTGNLVYSFGFNDTATGFNPIEGFAIASGGGLTAISGEPFAIGQGSWGQFDQSGSQLFVYASFIDVSTNTIVTQISPLSVGSGGTLTEPVASTTLVTPGFWAVADAP